MPWTEMSQSEFLEYVTNAGVAKSEVVFENAIKIMEIVVSNPERLHRSAYAMANHIKCTKEKSRKSRQFKYIKNSPAHAFFIRLFLLTHSRYFSYSKFQISQ